jgi:hypothetical protein
VAPSVFLSHANADRAVAQRLAESLMARGVEAFFDKWSIADGQSIRQRLEEGIESCTHFVVLLTPTSIQREWVKVEIDAAFTRAVEGHCKFIPLRMGLDVAELTPFLKTRKSPELLDFERDVDSLARSIHGISDRPALGPPVALSVSTKRASSFSPGATTLARALVEASEDGRFHLFEDDEVRRLTGLGELELEIALGELAQWGLIKIEHSFGQGRKTFFVAVKARTFARLDPLFKDWDPEEDAAHLAAMMVQGDARHLMIPRAAEELGWPPRRVNPALSVLIDKGVVSAVREISPDFETIQINANSMTMVYLKQRGRV